MKSFESGARCELCSSLSCARVRTGVRYDASQEVWRCTGCGLVFLYPRPDQRNLDDYYRNAYRVEYEDPALEELYRNDLKEARERVNRILGLVNRGSRVLEIGSGSGAFLDAVSPYVERAVGVEPDGNAVHWIRSQLKLEVLAEIPSGEASRAEFDLIVMFHVLEHVEHPVEFLSSLRTLLREDGTLVVEVPNIDDALIALYQLPSYEEFYYQKAHLYYFSPRTLSLVLEKAGYRGLVRGVQRYDLSNHIRWMLTNRPGGHEYYSDYFAPSLQAAYADSLTRSGHMDTVWAVATRNSNL